jgi:hypothetical protein
MMQIINGTNFLTFITTCVNEYDTLKETYYKNVKTYTINNNVEFILINFCDNETDNVTEYLTTNLYNEIKTGKLKYYKRNMPLNEFNIASLKNIAFTLANGKYLYNLDCDNYLDGNEFINLEKSIGLYGDDVVLHQNDGPSQILHSMWKDFNLCDLIWNETTGRICFNKKTFIDIGGYNENEKFNNIDSNINLLLRLINSNVKYIHINLSFKNSYADSKINKNYNFNKELAVKNIYSDKNENFIFKENINDYTLFDISEFKILTCFSVLYNCDVFIDNLLTDILSQTIFNNINFILINLPYTNNADTNNKINELNKYKNIKIIDEDYDYGLYNMWNKCIKMSETYLVSNMNPDDVRGPNWAYWQIINFEPNVALVTSKYTPTYKLVNHITLELANPLIIWFKNTYNIDDKNNIVIRNVNTYFTSKDMFQYNSNYTFQSNNICNCSPLWRKNIIHNDNYFDDNYFDEKKYGCYADFAVWLKAGSKEYVYKQTDYLVGFYIHKNQLHRRQTNDLNVLKELIIKYEPKIFEYQAKNIDNIPTEYFINNIKEPLCQKSDFKICKIIFQPYELIYINNDELWQKPVITELNIFDNLVKMRKLPYNYIAFPWANYIDNKWSNKYDMLEHIIDSEINSQSIIDSNKTYFTVIQHIEFRNYIEKLVKLNIKYIFTPHKMGDDYILENKFNIYIIPISLYPKQYNKYTNKPFIRNYEKKYLTSFIGLITHINMISNIRQEIYNEFKDKSDCFIKVNSQWYYENNVYGEQHTTEIISEDIIYKNNLFETKFALCPSGTGPNSIRLWEALSFGCIPVILSDLLILPIIPNIDYSDFCIFWKENNIDKLYDYLKSIDDAKITEMSKNGINMFIKHFSEYKMHYQLLYYFDNIASQEKNIQCINKYELPRDKIILICQYYILNNNDDNKLYNNARQKEIDYCLQKNFDNEYIDEIHIFLEEDCDFDFIKNKRNINCVKKITGKRINFKDIFEYYNNYLVNNICILMNSDIYLDASVKLVKNINFSKEKVFISLNRYENNDDNVPSLLNGLEMNDADFKNCQSFLKPYQKSIWSQDVWIWSNKIDVNDIEQFNFELGVVGCDNYLNYLMNINGYKVLNCSRIICGNHYDKLSIVKTEYGISKGNISNKKKKAIINNKTFLFLENKDDIPDKYTISINENITSHSQNMIKISDLSFEKTISEVKIDNFQIVSSSYSGNSFITENVLFQNDSYWEPYINDKNPFIQFNFENLCEICVIDISGKRISRNDYTCGYVKKFKISYKCYDDKWVYDNTLYDGVNIKNGNYIKKIYLDNPITCFAIKIHIIEYVNIRALKIRFHKYNHYKKDFYKYLVNNPEYFEKYNKTYLDYKQINQEILYNEASNYSYSQNILNQNIEEGICVFIYVMNRNFNIYNNINSWLKQNINQLIILDWSSIEPMDEYIKKLNDNRILYIRVINESKFIRTFAQNLAARFCKYNKICKMDSDIVMSDNFFENHKLNNGEFFVGEWRCARDENERYLHGNIYLFLNDYFRVNGYNEFIKDYGWDDSDFTIRLMTCGLTKKVFNYNYLYHTPHDELIRTVNLIRPMNSLLMTFINKECLQNIVWSDKYKLQDYNIITNSDNVIVCDRIKNNEYSIDHEVYEKAYDNNVKLLKSWGKL